MRLLELVNASQRITETSRRLGKIEILADLLGRCEGDQTAIVVSFLTGRLRQGRIGLGPAAIREAAPGESSTSSGLLVRDADETFARIATTTGKGSTAARVRLLRGLLERGTNEEQRFLTRLVFGELRQGALEGIMAEAIAKAAGVPARTVRRAIMSQGDPAEVAEVARTDGAAGLARFGIELFRPVRPMLAQPAEDAAAAIDRLGEAALEYKLDGARVQVHKAGREVRVFTRHLRDVTPAVPELVEAVRELPPDTLILDGETIALRKDGSPLPFQVTMRRFGRKLDVEALRETLPLSPFFFDVLYLDGAETIDEPYSRRSEILSGLVGEELRVPHGSAATAGALSGFLASALRRGHEGVMAKAVEAPYEAGSRGAAWLKIKPAHTLDLVILAAEWGSGRRRGWLSNLHLGARDPSNGSFVMLGKTFKGLTDEMLRWQTQKFLELEIGRDGHVVHVRPEVVAEIAFSDVQTSRQYPGGFALRFARVKSFRADKAAGETDTIDTVREIHRRSTEGPGA